VASTFRLEILLEAVDRATAPILRARQAVGAVAQAAGRLGQASGVGLLGRALGQVVGRANDLAGALVHVGSRAALLGGAAAVGGIALFRRQFLSTATQFERFSTILEVLEGDAERAGRAMSWVQDFARRTPYELDQVVDAFVRLRGAGVDASQFLEAVGNAAAARGRSLEDAAEAFNAALMGETERLRAFGIAARREGKRISFEYVVQGQRFRRVVDANNQAMIASTLGAIWNAQYPGAMDKLSQTWDGMVSNLADAWSRFTLAVMNAGVFDWLKDRLARLLETVERLAADGTLARWAQLLADRFVQLFAATERFLIGVDGAPATIQPVWQAIETLAGWVNWLGDTFGWTETVLGLLILKFGAPLLRALAAFGMAIKVLGIVLAATPIGRIVTGIALAAGLIVKYWEPIAGFFRGVWDTIIGIFQGAWEVIQGIVEAVRSALQFVLGARDEAAAPVATPEQRRANWRDRGRLSGFPMPEGLAEAEAEAAAEAAAEEAARRGGAVRVDTGGTLRIELDDRRTRVTGRPNDPGTRYSVDQGLVMGAP
jgi:hypothetical protein